jgi:RimJ/RimL family protein N-acetyltransferase
MNEIHVRPATLDDVPVIAELSPSAEDMRQTAPREMAPLDAEMVTQWLRERGSGFVLEYDGRIVAYGELNENSEERASYWIGHVMVHPRRRGSGFGRNLVGALLKHAMESLNAREVRISAFDDNPAALKCYRACGFTEGGRRFIDGRILVDFRFRDESGERILPPLVAMLLVLSAAGLTALLSPASAKFWLQDMSQEYLGFALILGTVVAGLMGLLLHPLLPRRSGSRVERFLLPVIYGASVALSSATLLALIFFVFARLGMGMGTTLLSQHTPMASGSSQPITGEALLWRIISQSLALGSGWGVILALLSRGLDRGRG